jgi:FkbM family methyltransferase
VLGARRRLRDEAIVDYGWIRLPYTGDGDWQEIYYHANQRGWYEKDFTIFRSLVVPGSTVVDVGANLGFVTTILSSLVGPNGRVLSFEPSRTTFAKLQRVVELNGLSNVSAFNVGCGERSEVQQLKRVGNSSGDASIVAGEAGGEDVNLVALDDVAEARAPTVSLVKIDTEGFEPFVLSGARELISQHRPVLYLEMGGDYAESTMQSIEILHDLNYDTRSVAEIEWSQFGNGSDFFFLPRELEVGRATG